MMTEEGMTEEGMTDGERAVRAAQQGASRWGVCFPRTSSTAVDSGLGYFRCVPPGRALGEDAPGVTESNRSYPTDSLVEDELTQDRLSVA